MSHSSYALLMEPDHDTATMKALWCFMDQKTSAWKPCLSRKLERMKWLFALSSPSSAVPISTF